MSHFKKYNRHIHDPVLTSLKMEGIRLLFISRRDDYSLHPVGIQQSQLQPITVANGPCKSSPDARMTSNKVPAADVASMPLAA
jgi:hypothetical protein